MKKVIGRFYFKKTINGNLLGEFSNNFTSKNYTESADLTSKTKKEDFVGLYISTWHDDEACVAKLDISRNKDLYNLKWTEGGNFDGQGMLCENNILIGNYWSVLEEK